MLLPHWLQQFAQRWSLASGRRCRRAGRAPTPTHRRVRPRLESLEERLTPSAPGGNPTVTQTAGSYTALNADVALDIVPNTNYVIKITGSFQFNSGGQVSISKLGAGSTMTIEGPSGTSTTLTGNGNRLFDIAKGQNVTFADLTLKGGTATSSPAGPPIAQGGAILNQGGTVSLSNVVVQGNIASAPLAEGGGIAVTGGGALTIGGSTIQSNQANGSNASALTSGFGGAAEGGGVFVSGASTVAIHDSTISGNKAQGGQGASGTGPGKAGNAGGNAAGGGLYVAGSGWTVTLTGDTVSNNLAIGGAGGNGVAGSNGGNGGNGGVGGSAEGGGAVFLTVGTPTGSTTLTILNDPTHASTIIDNSATGGQGGSGGAGGKSTGAANNTNGGQGGGGGVAAGGGVLTDATTNMGNTTLYGNQAVGGNGAGGGVAGTGGSGTPGTHGVGGAGAAGIAGGLLFGPSLTSSNGIKMVNSTIAKNTAAPGVSAGNTQSLAATGGGLLIAVLGAPSTATLDNDTITQNTAGGAQTIGGGVVFGFPQGATPPSSATNVLLFNNVIQGNLSGSTADDLDAGGSGSGGTTLSSASNNFIGSIIIGSVSAQNNTVGNATAQLAGVVGFDSKGNPTGGPIYYPLVSGAKSVGSGTTSVLSTIAGVEGTTTANVTDEIGNPMPANGPIDLGAVQVQSSSGTSAPTITTQPSNGMASVGGTVSFTAAASGNPTPTVQWEVSTNGGATFNSLSNGANVSGATTGKLTLSNVTAAMNGNEYEAVFSNGVGTPATTNAVTLTVSPPTAPAITSNPTSETVTAGQTAVFTAAATGSPTPTVQWEVSTNGGQTFSTISGATSTTLTVPTTSTAMSGNEYEAVFSNGVGSPATTTAATLTVHPPPPPPPLPPSPAPPPVLNPPPLLALLDSLFGGGTVTVNADGSETVTDSFAGIPLFVSTFDASGHLVSVDLFGFIDITILFLLL